jgi:hypothetical protein
MIYTLMGESVIGHDFKPIHSHDIMVFLVEVKTDAGQIFDFVDTR